ncbi:YafY family transcriptional regulator [Paenibacillus sp. 1011MAR3C5]|uniref:helix-turn-helix transcriptional regulator n=1 Tax=Paenibacillus sp. 1011MAR3C5 TaxID=1675787 RepID=UPI000E6C9681|nr:YafY family protein [Paenibacillus sp. 1011MAR3C5]RJE88834.1 YafY family transcriptional regulator [Paenibacillus sp. 1011MAR3C5]
MPKSKRLLELMMAVNRMRTFTVKELSQQFGVSTRTILRDLQELSELGVPLYSEVGPHGGYRILKERILPPIAFTEGEAFAIFFAIHGLRHYPDLPFEAEASSALAKFYQFMPQDIRDRIDQMRDRVDFVTPVRRTGSPHLAVLLDASMNQSVLRIDYESRNRISSRDIQPIGIYTHSGLWYCPAYCFQTGGNRVFRCDRMHGVTQSDMAPIDRRHIHLGNREKEHSAIGDTVQIKAELTRLGVQMCEAEPWTLSLLHVRENGTGWLEGESAKADLPFLASFMIRLDDEAVVASPPELLDAIRLKLSALMRKYEE